MSFGPYCYFNDGLSFRAVASNYVAHSGEVLFPDLATPTQLTSAFARYAAIAAAKTITVNVALALVDGLTITSTSTPDLDGTYSVGPVAQTNINATMTYILLNGTFPGGGTAMPWFDANGNPHVFPSVAVFKAFATAVANFVASCSLYGDSGGTIGSLPSSSVTIA